MALQAQKGSFGSAMGAKFVSLTLILSMCQNHTFYRCSVSLWYVRARLWMRLAEIMSYDASVHHARHRQVDAFLRASVGIPSPARHLWSLEDFSGPPGI